MTAYGGGKVERWWQRVRTAAVWRKGGGAKGRRRRLEMEETGETERKEKLTAGKRDI